MASSSIIGLVNNAALLLALGLIYDLLDFRQHGENSLSQQIVSGLILGAIGVAIMLNPWDFGQGVVFDTRSVLLCISGFFFGFIPLSLVIIITGTFRLIIGGTGAWTGLAVIISSGGIGLAWQYFRRNKPRHPKTSEFYFLGIVVHVVMLAWMLSLPWETAKNVLIKISIPVMLIYPLATAALGKLIVSREKRRESENRLQKSEEKFRCLFQYHIAAQLIIDPDTGQIVDANKAAENFYGWSVAELQCKCVQDINTLPPEQVALKMKKAKSLKRFHSEFKHRLADGSIREVEVYSSRIEIEGRQLLHSIIHDISDRRKAEESLRAREQFLQTIFKTTVDGFWALDTKGLITEVNQAYCSMSGYSREELIGKSIGELDTKETDEETAARIQRIISKGSEIFETLHSRKDQRIYPIEVSATYLDVDGGKFVCFGRDFTERKQAEKKISHKNDLLQYIIEHTNSAVAVHDKNMNYIYVSKNYLDQYGIKDHNIIGKHHYEVFPDLPQKWRDIHQKVLEGEIHGSERDDYHREDGSVEWTRWECRPWFEADGIIGGLIVYTEIITERIQAEEALRTSEARFRNMVEDAPDPIFIQTQMRFTYLNQKALTLFGAKDAQELIGTPVMERFHPDYHENVKQRIKGLNEHCKPAEVMEQKYLRMDGSTVQVEVTAQPIVYEDNNGALVFVRDITERKKLEAERQKFFLLAESSSEFIGMCDLDMNPLYVNPAGQLMVGLPDMEAACRVKVQDYYFPEDQQFIAEEFFPSVLREGYGDLEIRLRHFQTGEPIWVFYSLFSLLDAGGTPVGWATVSRDITERRQAEGALRESEATIRKKLKSIVEPEGDISTLELSDIMDIEIMQSMLEEFSRATGMLGAVLDLSGKVLVAFGWQDICTKFHRCHPDTLKNCVESDTALTRGVPPGTVKAYRCKNNMWDMVTPLMVGDRHIGNVFFGQFFYEGEITDVELFRAQARQHGFDETEYLAALARVPHFSREAAEACLLFSAQLAGIVTTLSYNGIKQARMIAERDRLRKELITLNTELELKVEQRTAALEASNKELESFSYSVSHDLRAPLRHISGYVDLLNKRFREALPEKAGHYLSEITDSASQMGTLIDDLLLFSRTGRQELLPAEMDMNAAVKEALENLKPDMKNRKLSWTVAELPRVFGDYSLLKQVWINLLDNAVKYTRDKGQAKIEVGCTRGDDLWEFFVRDNGVGFDMQYAHKLFGVFQRLHSPAQFEGTGIGLANVKRIVHKHGGRVRAEGRPDEGAAFYFTIPKNTVDKGDIS